MPSINPHINFNGNAEEAFEFYRSVFGGEFAKIMRFKEFAGPSFTVAKADEEKIIHIALPIGECVLIGNDVPEYLGRVSEEENRSKIAVRTESKEEADRIFAGLSAGGAIEAPMGMSPWGSYYGSFRDKYGIEWTVDCAAR